MENVRHSRLRLIILSVKVAGYAGLYLSILAIIGGALHLVFNSRLVPALTVGTLLLAFILVLTLRNQSRYNSILDCLYWDRPTVFLFIVSVAISAGFVWHAELVKRGQARLAAEQGRIVKESLADIESVSSQISESLSDVRSTSLRVESALEISALQNIVSLDRAASRKLLGDAGKTASAAEDGIASSQKQLFELGIPSLLRQHDQGLARELEKTKNSLLLQIARQYEEVFQLERRLFSLGDDLTLAAEIADRYSSLQGLDVRLKELENSKKDLEANGKTILGASLPRTVQDAMQRLLALLEQDSGFSRSIGELEIEYWNLDFDSGWKAVTERPAQTPRFSHLLAELTQRREELAGDLARERDLSDLNSLAVRVEQHVTFLVNEFSHRPEVRGALDQLVQQQAGLSQKVGDLQGLREELRNVITAYRGYRKYEHDNGHLVSEFERANSSDLRTLSSVLESQRSTLDDFAFECFYLSQDPDSWYFVSIKDFQNTYQDVSQGVDALRALLGTDLITKVPSGESIKSHFDDLSSQVHDLQDDFLDLSEYYAKQNIIRSSYERRLKSVKAGPEGFLKRAGAIYVQLMDESKTLGREIESQRSEVRRLQEEAKRIYARARSREQTMLLELVSDVDGAIDDLQSTRSQDLLLRVDAATNQQTIIQQRIRQGRVRAQNGVSFVVLWREILSDTAWNDESLKTVQLANKVLFNLDEFREEFRRMDDRFAQRGFELHSVEASIGSGEIRTLCRNATSIEAATRRRLITSYGLLAVLVVAVVWMSQAIIGRWLARRRLLARESFEQRTVGRGTEPLLNAVRSKTVPSHLREFAARRLTVLPLRNRQDHEAVLVLINELDSEPTRTAQKLLGILNDAARSIERRMAREI